MSSFKQSAVSITKKDSPVAPTLAGDITVVARADGHLYAYDGVTDRSLAYIDDISGGGGAGFTPLEGNGIIITEESPNYRFSVDDYISGTAVADVTGNLQSQIDVLTTTDQSLQAQIDTVTSEPVTYIFNAMEMDNPITADWAVNSLAPNTSHASNSGIIVRAFDATTEEGVGISIDMPPTANNIKFKWVSCGATTAGGDVVPKIYTRYLRSEAAISSWSAGTSGNILTMPASTNFVYDEETFTTTTLGISAGDIAFFEITRDASNGSDTLAVDWHLLKVILEIS